MEYRESAEERGKRQHYPAGIAKYCMAKLPEEADKEPVIFRLRLYSVSGAEDG